MQKKLDDVSVQLAAMLTDSFLDCVLLSLWPQIMETVKHGPAGETERILKLIVQNPRSPVSEAVTPTQAAKKQLVVPCP